MGWDGRGRGKDEKGLGRGMGGEGKGWRKDEKGLGVEGWDGKGGEGVRMRKGLVEGWGEERAKVGRTSGKGKKHLYTKIDF